MRTVFLVAILGAVSNLPVMADWKFTEVGQAAGAAHTHGFLNGKETGIDDMAGGVAAGDFDRDGDVDLYLITGIISGNKLLSNNVDGTFTDIAATAGVALVGHNSAGPAFTDINSDGWMDLVVGGINGAGYRVFLNRGDDRFEDITAQSGFFQQAANQNDFSSAFGDLDGDGDLDAFIAHWGARDNQVNHLWLNDGAGRFFPADHLKNYETPMWDDDSFTPNFVDMNGNGWQDILLASDFGNSQILLNVDGNSLSDITTQDIDDENGMGAAVADFDNDGDFDWFVTSIYHDDGPHSVTGHTGNRLYQNDGNGNFNDISREVGVREGHWGWGACAADFNNDGLLDIFHVNGMPHQTDSSNFEVDPSRLFIQQENGRFSEMSADLGIRETDQGRGVACLDYDMDGDIDIFTQNWQGPSHLFRNDLESNPGWLQVRLQGEKNNPLAVGAVIRLTTGDRVQTRQIAIGSNFESQNPLLQHFGLGGAGQADKIRIDWPHGGQTVLTEVDSNQLLTLDAANSQPPPFALEPGMSASWYDVSRNGEGFVIELLSGSRAVMYWFTYDEEGNQDWYTSLGKVDGRRLLFPELHQVSGGVFGPDFDPEAIVKTKVGSAAFTWNSCDTGHMDWFIGDRHHRQELSRLNRLMGLDCGKPRQVPTREEARYSGSWFDPSHNGEGYVIEVLDDARVLVYWFTYGPDGSRRWFVGVDETDDGKIAFAQMLSTHGGIFGPDYDPDSVEILDWGTLELDINCDGGTARYSSLEPAFGSGELDIVRLTLIDGLPCDS